MPWDPQMLEALAGLGLVPREDTAPELLREHINDLLRLRRFVAAEQDLGQSRGKALPVEP